MLCRLIWKHRVSLEETRDYKVLRDGLGIYRLFELGSRDCSENSIDNFKHSDRGAMNWRVIDVVFYMVIGIWQEAIFRLHHNDSAGWYAEKGLVLSDTVSGMKASFLHLLGLIANNEETISTSNRVFFKCNGSL